MIRYLAALFIGGLIGVLLYNWHFFEFERTFKWSDLLSIGVTTFVGFYIAEKLAEKQSTSRSEKDFLIGEIKEFKHELLKLKEKNDQGSILFSEAKTLFRDLNHDITHLQELSQYSVFCKKIDFSTLRGEFSKIRQLITGISPVNDSIIIPNDVRNKVDTRIDAIKKELYFLIVNINKAQK
jgi:hypothetical protein